MGILDLSCPPPWDSGVRAEKGIYSPPTTPPCVGPVPCYSFPIYSVCAGRKKRGVCVCVCVLGARVEKRSALSFGKL